jgi:hypothetical protein
MLANAYFVRTLYLVKFSFMITGTDLKAGAAERKPG